MTTKAVFFDLVGTLIYRKKELDTEVLCRILRDNNYMIYSQQFESAKRYVLFIEYPKGSIPDEKTFYRRIFQLLGHDVNEEVLKEIIDFSHENEVFEVFKDVKPCLMELSHRLYKMGIITSTPRFIFENVLRRSSIFGYFKTITTSSEAGVPKPDPRIFLTGLKSMSVTPEQSVYVTDDIQLDGPPLKELGIRCILIDRKHGTKTTDATYVVASSLEQIPDLL